LPTTNLSLTQTAPAGSATALAAILYDLDGTLANTDPLHYQIWWEMLQELGIDIDEKFYKSSISGRLNPAIVADLMPYLPPAEAQQFVERKEALFRERASKLLPMEGLMNLLTWAKEHGLKQAVVTNAPPENARYMLRSLHLQAVFHPVVIAEELGIGKPDPTPYRYALEQLGLSAEQAIAFEDSPSGIRSAVGAGIYTVGIASTQTPEVLYGAGARLVVPDFTASVLLDLLDQRIQ
jgi:HAD superfamily hydrolase (TIGR01509 family)